MNLDVFWGLITCLMRLLFLFRIVVECFAPHCDNIWDDMQ